MDFIWPDYANRVLVTGGAGFIGINTVIKLLRSTKAKIYNIDKLGYASDLTGIDEVLKELGTEAEGRYEFKQINLINSEILEEYINEVKPDLILHFAAESHVDRSIDSPFEFINSNIIGTFNLLEATRKYLNKISNEKSKYFRFHHISTDEVFGSLGETGHFSENTPYSPRSPYSSTKAASDHLVNAWFHTYGIPISITNCSNNYGPWQFPEKLIPLVILKAISGERIPLYGDGKNIRDWLFIDDHINAILLTALKSNPGENFCIGGLNEKSNREVVELICSILDEIKPSNTPYSKLIQLVDDRPGHDFRYSINPKKIKAELDWHPKYKFKDGLLKTIKWYLKNLNWCKKIQERSTYKGERLGI